MHMSASTCFVTNGRLIFQGASGSALSPQSLYTMKVSGGGRKLIGYSTACYQKGKKLYAVVFSYTDFKTRVISCNLDGTGKKTVRNLPSGHFFEWVNDKYAYFRKDNDPASQKWYKIDLKTGKITSSKAPY